MFTIAFWKAAAERAIKTAAQSAIAALGMDALNVFNADWQAVAGLALGGAVLSVLTSIASGVVSTDGPSLAGERLDEYLPAHAATRDGAGALAYHREISERQAADVAAPTVTSDGVEYPEK